MKSQVLQVLSVFQKIDKQHVQIALSLLALVLFVLGVGAPEDAGLTPR
jgi:hypothetical protein